jgi:TPR repeat protein
LLVLALALALVSPPVVAQASAQRAGSAAAVRVTPAQQARLDAALRDHDAGRLAAAQHAFEALARERVPAALHNLAVMHLEGELPGADVAVAERLLVQAARLGFVTSMFTLGQGYEIGAFGRRDLVRAHDWYERAARAGSVEAQVAMGTAHFLGRGRPRDAGAAAAWYLVAARAGDVGAMYLVASMYEAGDGVERDLRLARYWYGAAARQGDPAAAAKVQELDARAAAAPG